MFAKDKAIYIISNNGTKKYGYLIRPDTDKKDSNSQHYICFFNNTHVSLPMDKIHRVALDEKESK